MTKKNENVKNRIYVRVYNEEQIKEMDGLIASERFSSKSEIIGKCIDIALPLLTSGKTSLPQKNSSADVSSDLLKKQSAILKEISVISNLTFNLIQSIFTERALSLSGKQTTADDLNNGVYENLPDYYQNLLAELLR